MATLPASLAHVSSFLQRLPGIGEKSANRLAFYLLRIPDAELQAFARDIAALKSQTKRCSICQNLCENEEVCVICEDSKRDKSVITVVETVLDILAFETGGIYQGVYHVLHGKIDPLNRVGPDDLTIELLYNRVKDNPVTEIILATNPDMEGEATAMYIRNQLRDLQKVGVKEFKVSRLAYGLPMGGNVEYADYVTLKKAIEGRDAF